MSSDDNTYVVVSSGQTGGITAASVIGGHILQPTQSKVVCARHGEHEKQSVVVWLGDITTLYPYCPYCYGEWMSWQFRVVEAS